MEVTCERERDRLTDWLALLPIDIQTPIANPSSEFSVCSAFAAIILGLNVLLCHFCPIYLLNCPRSLFGSW